jgi:hypothetical protein
MASRQEEKERRRREREEAERAAASAAARKRRLGMVAGAVLALALVGVVALVVAGGGDDGPSADSGGGDVRAPTQNVRDLQAAARAADCRVSPVLRNEGATHVSPNTDVRYRTNPPTSGNHSAIAARDGDYSEVDPPDLKQSVHALEHGRINIQYRPGTDPRRVAQLRAMFNEELNDIAGYKSLLFENQTRMPHAVAATAWTRMITCSQINDRTFDALRAFRREFVDVLGPEQGIPHGA